MLKNALVILSALVVFTTFSQDPTFQGVQSPSEFLGYEHGTYFSRHHQVIDYFKMLESSSGVWVGYGRSSQNFAGHRTCVCRFRPGAEGCQAK